MKRMIIAVALWVFALPALAQEGANAVVAPPAPIVPPAEDWPALRTRAAELRETSRQLQAEAERKHALSEKACWEKFLVSACIEDAAKARQDAEGEAKRIEHEARDIERRVKAHERAEKEAKRIADEPRREAELARRAEKNRREQEEARQRVEKKQAEAAQRSRK